MVLDPSTLLLLMRHVVAHYEPDADHAAAADEADDEDDGDEFAAAAVD